MVGLVGVWLKLNTKDLEHTLQNQNLTGASGQILLAWYSLWERPLMMADVVSGVMPCPRAAVGGEMK